MPRKLILRSDFIFGGVTLGASALAGCGGSSGSSIAPVIHASSATPTNTPSTMPSSTPTVVDSANVIVGAKTSSLLTSGFAGLSYEKAELSTGLFTSTDSSLVGCFKGLGKSLLRVGGVSVDQTSYVSTASGGVSGQIGQPDISALGSFLSSTGWQVLYGINLGNNTPQNAAAEAEYVAQTLGSSLYGFEIGSQPDQYASNGTRNSSYTVSEFITEWQTYATQILAAVPSAKLAGPATTSASVSTWTVPFASSEPGEIALLTQHYYRGDGTNASSTSSELLTPDPALLEYFKALGTAASSAGISGGYRMAETNSFFNGGSPGVSNALASALWAIDYMMLGLVNGCAGFNFHGGGSTGNYTPIADSNDSVVEVRPEYYALLMASQISAGVALNVITETMLPFTAYAVDGNDGALYVLLINKGASEVAQVGVSLPRQVGQGTELILTGTGLSATSGTTLGGATVSSSGQWTPSAIAPFAIGGTSFQMTVPAATAVVVRCA